MSDGVTIRDETAADIAGIRAIHEAAFGGRAEADLVEALRREGDLAFALTASAGGPVGHVAFPRLALERAELRIVALAPLAVLPAWHSRGVGTALVRAALDRARADGEDVVLVRGHRTYYLASVFRKRPPARSGPPTTDQACTRSH